MGDLPTWTRHLVLRLLRVTPAERLSATEALQDAALLTPSGCTGAEEDRSSKAVSAHVLHGVHDASSAVGTRSPSHVSVHSRTSFAFWTALEPLERLSDTESAWTRVRRPPGRATDVDFGAGRFTVMRCLVPLDAAARDDCPAIWPESAGARQPLLLADTFDSEPTWSDQESDFATRSGTPQSCQDSEVRSSSRTGAKWRHAVKLNEDVIVSSCVHCFGGSVDLSDESLNFEHGSKSRIRVTRQSLRGFERE